MNSPILCENGKWSEIDHWESIRSDLHWFYKLFLKDSFFSNKTLYGLTVGIVFKSSGEESTSFGFIGQTQQIILTCQVCYVKKNPAGPESTNCGYIGERSTDNWRVKYIMPNQQGSNKLFLVNQTIVVCK